MKKLILSLMLGMGFVSQIQKLKAQESLALNFNGINSIIEFPAIRFDEYEEVYRRSLGLQLEWLHFQPGPFR